MPEVKHYLTYLDIMNLKVSYDTAIYQNDENFVTIFFDENDFVATTIQIPWEEKYKATFTRGERIESIYAEIKNEHLDKFFEDYPKLKEQLRINTTYGCELWIDYPEGLKRSDLDLFYRD